MTVKRLICFSSDATATMQKAAADVTGMAKKAAPNAAWADRDGWSAGGGPSARPFFCDGPALGLLQLHEKGLFDGRSRETAADQAL